MAAKPNNTRSDAPRQVANGTSARRAYVATPEPKHHGYQPEIREQSIRMYLDGLNFRHIGRLLGVHHTSVMNWINAYADTLDEAPVPDTVETIEMDELYSYVGSKKKRLYLMTFVDRRTRCILQWRVVETRTGALVQEMVHESPQAQRYFSDGFEGYQTALYWPASHMPMEDKSETYSVEGDNAELRHYLARLGRRSRCFNRCIHALRRAVKLFVFAFNRRLLALRRFPAYPLPLIDFAHP